MPLPKSLSSGAVSLGSAFLALAALAIADGGDGACEQLTLLQVTKLESSNVNLEGQLPGREQLEHARLEGAHKVHAAMESRGT